ncbi:MAG: NAD(P)-dependent oxidoreductase, partial [Bacilli bacterium]
MSESAASGQPQHRLDHSVHRPLGKAEILAEAHRCLYCYDAPCVAACPTHIDVPSFIRKITTDNVVGSARVIMEANPLGASCARVCPTDDLCEGACVLGKDAAPLRIGDLQRYSTDWVRERKIDLFTPGPPSGKRVAVVGGGPAGLAAARELARFGHEATVYEAQEQLGGLNTYGIVPFRLPRDVALWEAEQVMKLGVVAHTGVLVGRDVAGEDLVRDFDAVVLAFGMGSVPPLQIPGEDLQGVWDALDFISRVKSGQDIGGLGERVVVIGAGNTAIDAATCSKRLNVDNVAIYYRRTENEMTAYPFEYAFAKQEGVEFRWLCAPVRILGEGGRVRAVEFVKTRLEVSDYSKRASPIPVPGTEFTVEVDAVIRATGQSRLTSLLDALRIAHDDGVVRVDPQMRTDRAGVFAAGDCSFRRGAGDAMV